MRILRVAIVALAIISLLGMALVAAAPFLKNTKLLSVQTGSMIPVFHPGDAVWVRKVSMGVLKPGDIISYQNPGNRNVVVTHRLVSIDFEKGIMITKGDNELLNDLPVFPGFIIGRVNRVIPKAGFAIDWLHRPEGIALTVYTPCFLLLLSEYKRLANILRSKPYKIHVHKRVAG